MTDTAYGIATGIVMISMGLLLTFRTDTLLRLGKNYNDASRLGAYVPYRSIAMHPSHRVVLRIMGSVAIGMGVLVLFLVWFENRLTGGGAR